MLKREISVYLCTLTNVRALLMLVASSVRSQLMDRPMKVQSSSRLWRMLNMQLQKLLYCLCHQMELDRLVLYLCMPFISITFVSFGVFLSFGVGGCSTFFIPFSFLVCQYSRMILASTRTFYKSWFRKKVFAYQFMRQIDLVKLIYQFSFRVWR